MLCGLADGLDAVIAQGVQPRRLLLIGGAALNPAVQTTAAQLFGVPVHVPTPGEYVAMGGAVQAGWVLAGRRPAWVVDTAAELAADPQPVIREQYARARSAY
jgi:xylulokinase